MDLDYIKEYLSNIDLVKANAIEVTKDCFKFDGNLNRTKYFTYWIVLTIIGMICGVISVILGLIPIVGFFAPLIMLVPFVMSIGPWTRRLRDAGYGPIQFLWFLLCIVGGIVPMVLTFFKSANEEVQAAQPAAQPAEQPQDQPPAGN